MDMTITLKDLIQLGGIIATIAFTGFKIRDWMAAAAAVTKVAIDALAVKFATMETTLALLSQSSANEGRHMVERVGKLEDQHSDLQRVLTRMREDVSVLQAQAAVTELPRIGGKAQHG